MNTKVVRLDSRRDTEAIEWADELRNTEAWFQSRRFEAMANFIEMGGLRIDPELYGLVRDEIAPGTGIQPERFWSSRQDRHGSGSQDPRASGETQRAPETDR